MISRFYIRAQISRTTKSSLRKVRKRSFLCKNISSHGFFSFYIITFCRGFTRTEKKYANVIYDDICNRKIELKSKSEIMKSSRNYKEVGKKIWRVLKCKEIVAFRDFFTNLHMYNPGFESLFLQTIRIWKLLFRSVGT